LGGHASRNPSGIKSLRAEQLTVVCSVGLQLWQAAGTSPSHLWDPFLQFLR
jgi:hypothetical protein